MYSIKNLCIHCYPSVFFKRYFLYLNVLKITENPYNESHSFFCIIIKV